MRAVRRKRSATRLQAKYLVWTHFSRIQLRSLSIEELDGLGPHYEIFSAQFMGHLTRHTSSACCLGSCLEFLKMRVCQIRLVQLQIETIAIYGASAGGILAGEGCSQDHESKEADEMIARFFDAHLATSK
jgi:hypothetical protein